MRFHLDPEDVAALVEALAPAVAERVIRELRRQTPARSQTDGDELPDGLLLTPREAAREYRVCTRTLTNLAARGQITPIKIGTATRYSRADLERWVQEQTEAAAAVP